MKITHLGHAAVLVETDSDRILIDPGNFSQEWHGVTDLSAVLVTHQHPDHIDPDHVGALLQRNPDARVWTEPSVLQQVEVAELADRAEPLAAGERRTLGGLTVTGVGGQHAVIHADLARIGNTGVLLQQEGEPTFFHPGDMLDTTPAGVDVIAVPLHGPWAAMKEHIDFVRALGASHGFGIHEALLSERGWQLAFTRIAEMGPTTMVDSRDHAPMDFPA
ncbi:MBL fold metallo-hydrolase [Parenemella sanctibonifatiensis]|uniref:Zn-dependent hydrolase n=1 Tax=Parenemella sanctibonifatiensis TaxID=2016505 RepID=A0A255EE46_9ACTN|nr:MBL fold metallo-hydrolase [Parenemella sanctibonifatiensis]OYN89809.1 Zn-dependent hydrolase [Parenemella sanctibonifatiensis]